jgi:hypothetical protein
VEWRDGVLGDLLEGYRHRARHGRLKAECWYWRQVVTSIGPLLAVHLKELSFDIFYSRRCFVWACKFAMPLGAVMLLGDLLRLMHLPSPKLPAGWYLACAFIMVLVVLWGLILKSGTKRMLDECHRILGHLEDLKRHKCDCCPVFSGVGLQTLSCNVVEQYGSSLARLRVLCRRLSRFSEH